MASVFKRVTNKGTVKWYARYKSADGRWCKMAAGTDKGMALQIAAKHEYEGRLRQEGFVTADMDIAKAAGALPLTDHINAWKAALLAKGNTAKHADMSASQMLTMSEACNLEQLSDISAEKVSQWLADQRGKRMSIKTNADSTGEPARSMSAQTSNHYLRAAKSFCHWAMKTGRATSNPLAFLQPVNAKADRRHDRRALTPDELRQLLNAARAGRYRFGMTGEARAMLYRLAAETGLRAGELRSLTAGAFALSGNEPSVTVRAGYTKNGQEATLPLRADTAAALREYLAGKTSKTIAFNMPSSDYTADMLKADLGAARKAWLDGAQSPVERAAREQSTFCSYRDDAGRCADFHALRHTFISYLAAGGVHPKTAQQLARHSSITLTMDRYTHVFRGDITGALDVLPGLDPVKEVLRATGTTDTGREENIPRGTNVGQITAGNGRELADNDISTGNSAESQNPHEMAENSAFIGENLNEGDGDRTRNLRIDNPML